MKLELFQISSPRGMDWKKFCRLPIFEGCNSSLYLCDLSDAYNVTEIVKCLEDYLKLIDDKCHFLYDFRGIRIAHTGSIQLDGENGEIEKREVYIFSANSDKSCHFPVIKFMKFMRCVTPILETTEEMKAIKKNLQEIKKIFN